MSERRWDEDDRLRYGYQFARLHRFGNSLVEIAAKHDCSPTRVREVMLLIGYEPSQTGRAPPAKAKSTPIGEDERPYWSRPDPITLRLVREAREDMKRAGW